MNCSCQPDSSVKGGTLMRPIAIMQNKRAGD